MIQNIKHQDKKEYHFINIKIFNLTNSSKIDLEYDLILHL